MREHRAVDLMPKDKHSHAILLQRARKFAEVPKEIEKNDTIHYIRFYLGNNEYYGIPYQNAQEVINNVTLTKIPHTQDCVAGVMNYRGTLLAIIDLKKFFQLPITEYPEKMCVIVTKMNNVLIGILAEDIEGSEEYDKENITSDISYQGGIDQKYLLGLHQGTTTLLNIEAIILDVQSLLSQK